MEGAEGFKQMLGILNYTDGAMGGVGKQVTGLSVAFTKLQQTTVLTKIAKDIGLNAEELTKQQSVIDRMRKIFAAGEKGMQRFKSEFKGPEATKMMLLLSEPFNKAVKDAKAAGKTPAEATKAGLEAFDRTMADMAKTNMKAADITGEAAKQMELPQKKLVTAYEKVIQSFTKPEMVEALGNLAERLPKVADALVKIIDFVGKHPVLAATGAMTLKFGSAAIPAMVSSGVGFSKAAAPGLAAAGGKFGGGASGKLGKVAGAAFGLAAAASIGYAVGEAIAPTVYEEAVAPTENLKLEVEKRAREANLAARSGVSMEEKKAKFDALKKATLEMHKAKPSYSETAVGLLSMPFGGKSEDERYQDATAKSNRALTDLAESINNQKTASDGAAKGASAFTTALSSATEALNKMAKKAGGGDNPTPGGNPRGPMPYNTQPGWLPRDM
jgi:hypothetical protein